MSLPNNQESESVPVQAQPNPSLEGAQNVTPVQKVADSVPETISNPVDAPNTKETQPISQNSIPNGSESISKEVSEPQLTTNENSESAPQSDLQNSTLIDDSTAKEEDSKPETTGKKRGRKPNVPNKLKNFGANLPETSKSGRQIKKISIFQVTNEPTSKKRTTAAKSSSTGKRGRPKKIVEEGDETKDPAAKGKRGRPKKATEEGDDANKLTTKEPGTKGKRGRPKKAEQNPDSTQTESNLQSNEGNEDNEGEPENKRGKPDQQEPVSITTDDKASIPTLSDNPAAPQTDSSANPQPTSDKDLNTQQSELVTISSDTQQKGQPEQQPTQTEDKIPLVENIKPQTNGVEHIIQPSIGNTNAPTLNEQQISNDPTSKSTELTNHLNDTSAQNQLTSAAPTSAPEAIPPNPSNIA